MRSVPTVSGSICRHSAVSGRGVLPLKKLGKFEVRVLLFAVKHKLMTKELALYTANLASQMKTFDPHLYKVLEKAYDMYEESMILTAICTLLIKGNCMDSRYFKWYENSCGIRTQDCSAL